MSFEQVRKRKPSWRFDKHPFVVACPPMKSNCNISMLARSASCLGASRFIVTGHNKVDSHIARDYNIIVGYHRSLLPAVKKYKQDNYKIIGLEQSTNSKVLYDYKFEAVPTMMVIGNECKGMPDDVMDQLDEVIEIPLFGPPHSLNVAMAASLCLYEYARQINYRG